jgi:hypothetical protein
LTIWCAASGSVGVAWPLKNRGREGGGRKWKVDG